MNSIIFTLVIVIGFIDYSVGGPVSLVISGSKLNEVCELAQNLTADGKNRDDIAKILDAQLHQILGLTGPLKKVPIVRYAGATKSHPMARYGKRSLRMGPYMGSTTHSGERNDASPTDTAGTTQTGTFNFNVSDLIYVLINAFSRKLKARCLPSQSLCSAIVLPEKVDLLDQQQMVSIIDQLFQLQGSLIDCDSS
ncbi:uncharacterized protein LOC128390721 [Panonychus citri]|uniref:uncharacterized protein LOC128390721 n=1 Tax=Panonychus citri TaxID=50023 RepID=UPI0023081551|nr:uncharacterized protein LOC128390721 [Panonychus citri]